MSHEIMVGLLVADEASYKAYRDGMTPILHSYGGDFRHDFRVSEVLITQAQHDINRVFAISFPDRATKEKFFSDPKYLSIRRRYYEPVIKGRTILAEYDRA